MVLVFSPAAFAQHEPAPQAEGHPPVEAHETAEEHAPAGHGDLDLWKWANFLLLAGLLGYFLGKNAGPFFSARTRQIRKDMMEADETRRDAEAKAAAVDQRLANLHAEIEALRREAREEQAAEEERIRRQTAADIERVQHHAEQEIASAAKAARAELKRYSAELALEQAEQKIQARMNPQAQDALVRGFVRDLQQPT
jgi:F-type H+-transporting ATPase subunit b